VKVHSSKALAVMYIYKELKTSQVQQDALSTVNMIWSLDLMLFCFSGTFTLRMLKPLWRSHSVLASASFEDY